MKKKIVLDSSNLNDSFSNLSSVKRNTNIENINLSSDQLQLLINKSPVGIIIIGDDFKVEYLNQALAAILKIEPQEIIGKDFRILLTGKDLNLAANHYSSRREGKSAPENYQLKAAASDGSTKHLDLTATITTDKYGKVKTVAQIIDITDKIKTNQALENSELKYETLVENSPYSIILSGMQGKLITVNPKTLSLFGYENMENIINNEKTLLDFVSENDRKRAYRDSQKTIKNGAAGPFEYIFQKMDGSLFFGELSGSVIHSSNAKAIAYMAIISDISERIIAEKELKESQMSLENTFNAIQDGISVLDSSLNVVMTNRWMEKMYEKEMPLKGKKCYEVYHQSSEPCELCPTIESIRSGEPVTEKVPYKSKGKEIGFLELSSFPVKDEKGKVIQIIEYVKNISEQENALQSLKKTSSKLANMMKAANDGMWDWHLNSGVVEFDPRYYEMAGYDFGDFPHTLEAFQKCVHPDDINNVMDAAQAHLNGDRERYRVEFRFLRKDNSWMWILGRGIIVERDVKGTPVRLMGTHTDITELKKIQNDLRVAKNKAEESDRLKTAFLANMSHEIRTPMNGILGFASLLHTEDLSRSEQKDYIDIIQQSGNRMLSTINDIIDLSKIEAGQIDVFKTEQSLNDHINYLYDFFLPEVQKKNLELKHNKGLDDDSAIILADHEKILAVYINLLKNAIKFTKEGVIEFGYKLNGDEILLFVKDTGIGISKNRQTAIFERFIQEDLNITKPYEGSGLGLSISKGIMELLGGKIWVESEQNKGSHFFFSMPYVIPENKSIQGTINENELITTERLKKLNVLIAEDDESAIFYLNEVLKRKCNKIMKVRTGIEAVEMCKKDKSIGLVLMDIKMPEIDGFEATRRIREFNKDIIIIAQTAYALVGDKNKVIEAGCNDYVTKPINKKELIQTIEKYF